MPMPELQTVGFPLGASCTVTVQHYLDMTGWALRATLTSTDGGTSFGTAKTTGSGITITTGDQGPGTAAVIDYTDGTSKNLIEGDYLCVLTRTDAAQEDTVMWAVVTVQSCLKLPIITVTR
jgi:hypothetical protein